MIELFQAEKCPYCEKVRKKLNELGVSFVAHCPWNDEEQKERQMRLGGDNMVPFLYDEEEDVAMYESDDIVEYLEERYG